MSFTSLPRIICLLFLCTLAGNAQAQCCSVGNPVMGLGSVGVLDPGTLRSISFFKSGWSDTYYEGSEPALLQGKTASYNYFGQLLGYGITKRFGMELELGYFLNKTEEDEWVGRQNTYGLSSAVLLMKALAWKKSDVWELSAAAGVKIPMPNREFQDEFGLPYPVTLQPSFQAFGGVGQIFLFRNFRQAGLKAVLLNRFEFNGVDKDEYRMGKAWFSSLFLSKGFAARHMAILQFRNEMRGYDYQGLTRFSTTGGNILILSPQYALSLKSGWKIFLSADLPLYRNYNGMQLGSKMAGGISLMRDFHKSE